MFATTVLLLLATNGIVTPSLLNSTIFAIEFCPRNIYIFSSYLHISRAECIIRCLNFDRCFGVMMKEPPKGSAPKGIVASCQLMPNLANQTTCSYVKGLSNYYHMPVDLCDHFRFTKYKTKCYKKWGNSVAAEVDSACRQKFKGSRGALPRNQEEMDDIFAFLKLANHTTHQIMFDYKEANKIIRIRNGPVVNFTKDLWYKRQPEINRPDQPDSADEECVALHYFKLHDFPCTRPDGFICEMDIKN